MKLKSVISPVFILICVASVAAQDAAIIQPTEINSSRQPQVSSDAKVKELAVLREKTVSLLKATGREASSLNMPENRIRYLTDAAEMLWQHDEKTARNFFANAMHDFRELLQSLETAHQQSANGEAEEDLMGGMFGGGGRGNSRRVYQMQNIRRNLVTTLAKYDAQAAYDFFRETQRENLKEYSAQDSGLESQLAALLAKNDPNRALEVALQKLSKNEFDGLSELTMNLYEKDAAKGAKLASEIVRKLRGVPSNEPYLSLQTASSLFQNAVEIADKKQSDKPRLLEDGNLQELAEAVIKNINAYRKLYNYVGIESYSSIKEGLKKYAPASFAKLERDIETGKAKVEAAAKSEDSDEEQIVSPKPVAVEAQTTTVTSAGGDSGTAVITATPTSSRDAQAEALTRLMKAATTGEEKLSADEVRKTLSQIRSRPQRLMALTQIAKSFAERGDKETAKDLLKDTAEFQVAQPRKAPEMLQNLMLADALSGVDADRAFTLLEYTLFEVNGVATSFHRIGEFMDAKEIADGNEFNMSGFPREMLQVGSTGGLGLQRMLFNLASADFDRTAALADKLERPELRLETRMLIVRSLLSKDMEMPTK